MSTKNKVRFINEEREYPLELRLLQYFICAEEVWALFNLVMNAITKSPMSTIKMYLVFATVLPVYWIIAHFSKYEKYFISMYFVIYLLSLPFVWHFAGGTNASANVLFTAELVFFAMCLRGKRQKLFLILSVISSTMMSALPAITRGAYRPVVMSDFQIIDVSRNMGLSTSILIVSLLLRQKKEYEKERDAAVKSEKELEKSNQLQKNFLANMSHEIRSPLGIVLGFNGLIAGSNDIDQIHEYSENITNAGKTLHTVINDILDYSKIESGKLDIINDDYSFKALINEIKNDIGLKSAEKGLSFKIKTDESIPTYLYGDNIRIKQCLLNLLSNAVKYTDQGTVSLDVTKEASEKEGYCKLKFIVSDTGKGISEDALPNLFDSFQRLDEGHNRGIEGTGLGLAITKSLIDEMNGSIEVDSKYGEGSTFTLYLEQKISDKAYSMENHEVANVDISGVNILAVDDTKVNLILIDKMLGKCDAKVTAVGSGEICLKVCAVNKFDVILLDHMMPEMDGVEVFKHLRSEDGLNKNTPVIMLTANAMAGANKEYMDLGFDGYVSKPINVQELKETIVDVLNK